MKKKLLKRTGRHERFVSVEFSRLLRLQHPNARLCATYALSTGCDPNFCQPCTHERSDCKVGDEPLCWCKELKEKHGEFGRLQKGKRKGDYDLSKWLGSCCFCEEGGKMMQCNDCPYVAHRVCVEKNLNDFDPSEAPKDSAEREYTGWRCPACQLEHGKRRHDNRNAQVNEGEWLVRDVRRMIESLPAAAVLSEGEAGEAQGQAADAESAGQEEEGEDGEGEGNDDGEEGDDNDDVEALRVWELRFLLRCHGECVSGRKAELVERLVAALASEGDDEDFDPGEEQGGEGEQGRREESKESEEQEDSDSGGEEPSSARTRDLLLARIAVVEENMELLLAHKVREWHHDGPQFKDRILAALKLHQFWDLRDYWGKIKPTKCMEAVGEGTQAGLSVYGSLVVFRNPTQELRERCVSCMRGIETARVAHTC